VIERPTDLNPSEAKLWNDAEGAYARVILEDWKKDFLTLRAQGWTVEDIRAQKSPLDCLSIAQHFASRSWTVDR